MFSPGIKSPKRTYFLLASCSRPHTWQPCRLPRQALTVSTTWSPRGAAGKIPKFAKLAWQQLPTAPQNINPSEVHMAPISERVAAVRGKRHKGRRGRRPAMPPWRRSRRRHGERTAVGTQLEIHSWKEVLCAGGGTSECVHPQIRPMLELRCLWRLCGLCVSPEQN